MDAAAATALLERLAQPDVSPLLTDGEMTGLLADAATVDADGYAPEDDEWTPTYARGSVYAAAVAAIDLKIAKIAVTHVNVSHDGASFSQDQAVAHLKDLRLEYQRRAGGSIPTRATWARAASPVVNWNDPTAEVP